MRVVSLQPEHLSDLYALYREVTADVAHCRFQPSEAQFGERLTQPAPEGTRVLVAEDAGRAVGFAAVRDAGAAKDGVEEAQLTALFVRDEAPGQMLVEACLGLIGGARRWMAFPDSHRRCPIPAYNAGWDGLSDRLRVAARVLVRNGFKPYYRELHLEIAGDHFPPLVTPAPSEVTFVERTATNGQPVIVAMDGDEEVGVCMYSTVAHLTDHPEAAQWGCVMWLHVAESLRRRGAARHLLTRTLRQLSDGGCRGCWLTTGADNWPAQPLYLGMGFEIVDASACFRMDGNVR
jgi:ribosomal protein S18 acetylase RimI-like enzyme